MKKIFKDGIGFIVCGDYTDEPDGGKRYTKKGLMNYLINEAPKIDIDTRALERDDNQMIWQAYHKGLRMFHKKNIGV